jgi:hypothetical protein
MDGKDIDGDEKKSLREKNSVLILRAIEMASHLRTRRWNDEPRREGRSPRATGGEVKATDWWE